jgi:hypothetical protein
MHSWLVQLAGYPQAQQQQQQQGLAKRFLCLLEL